jgi:pyrroline-5-carboxylate reductase
VGSEARILLVGFGNMGRALARGWLDRGRAPGTILVVDSAPEARSDASALGMQAVATAAEHGARDTVDVVLFAVKPNQLAEALGPWRAMPGGPVFLSIAAGKTITQIEAALPGAAAVVRAMPNTPAAIGRGMTVLVANAHTTDAQRSLCGELLGAVGRVAWVTEEAHMDAVTAVSGSGPAYVFLLIECLERAAIDVGLAPALARELALTTVAGAGAYAESSPESPAELRRRVTSPGGTTQAALDVLMDAAGLEALLKRAVRAATERGRELAKT